MNGGENLFDWNPITDLEGHTQSSGVGFSERWQPKFRPEEFANLKIGEFVIHHAGRKLRSGESFTKI